VIAPDHQELRELVQMANDLSPRDGSLLRLARQGARPAKGTQSGRVTVTARTS
jgi:hypothetical protein